MQPSSLLSGSETRELPFPAPLQQEVTQIHRAAVKPPVLTTSANCSNPCGHFYCLYSLFPVTKRRIATRLFHQTESTSFHRFRKPNGTNRLEERETFITELQQRSRLLPVLLHRTLIKCCTCVVLKDFNDALKERLFKRKLQIIGLCLVCLLLMLVSFCDISEKRSVSFTAGCKHPAARISLFFFKT